MDKYNEMSENAIRLGEFKPANTATLIAQEWKSVLTSRRKKDESLQQEYRELSEKDSEHYGREMEVYKVKVEAKESA